MTLDPARRRALLAALSSAALAGAARADEAAQRPLRIVVPYAAGGTTDQVARLLQRPMGEALGRPVIVENRPGAAGTVGTEWVARAAPDGSTVVFGNPAPNAIVPALRRTGYDPLTDLRPIGTVAVMPMFLVVPANSPADSLAAFIEQARRGSAPLNYGSSGVGSFAHLTGALFARLSGLQMTHIPYAGGAPMMTALLQGDLQASFATGLDGGTMVQAGRARYLAVGSEARMAGRPELPAIAEVLPGFRSVVWFALLAPKDTPDPVVQRLHAALALALEKPEVRKYLSDRDAEARGSTPGELSELIRRDMKQWSEVAREARIEI